MMVIVQVLFRGEIVTAYDQSMKLSCIYNKDSIRTSQQITGLDVNPL